jgi:hypothetical protein
MTGESAYERLVEALRAQGKIVRDSGTEARTLCPSCDSRNPTSLAIYRKDGKAKIVCYVSCEDTDVLDALDLDWRDLYDERSASESFDRPVKKHSPPKSPVERTLARLLAMPDLGERLCRCIAAQGGDHD